MSIDDETPDPKAKLCHKDTVRRRRKTKRRAYDSGQVLAECISCHTQVHVPYIVFQRAARPKCFSCGWEIYPTTDYAERLASIQKLADESGIQRAKSRGGSAGKDGF